VRHERGERLCAKISQLGIGMFCGLKFLVFSHFEKSFSV
jgi:hypothetical protein